MTRDQLFPLKKKKAGLDGANISHDANLQPQQDTELQTAQKTMIYWPNPKSSPPPCCSVPNTSPPNFLIAVPNSYPVGNEKGNGGRVRESYGDPPCAAAVVGNQMVRAVRGLGGEAFHLRQEWMGWKGPWHEDTKGS